MKAKALNAIVVIGLLTLVTCFILITFLSFRSNDLSWHRLMIESIIDRRHAETPADIQAADRDIISSAKLMPFFSKLTDKEAKAVQEAKLQ